MTYAPSAPPTDRRRSRASTRLDAEAQAREVHMHYAGALILTTQDQLIAPGMQQLAMHRVDTIVHRGNAHRLPSLETIGVDECFVRQRRRRCLTRHGNRLLAAHLAQRAMTEAHHPGEPGGNL